MEFSRQEYWSGLPFPSPESFWPRAWSLVSWTAGRFFTIWATREAQKYDGEAEIVYVLKCWDRVERAPLEHTIQIGAKPWRTSRPERADLPRGCQWGEVLGQSYWNPLGNWWRMDSNKETQANEEEEKNNHIQQHPRSSVPSAWKGGRVLNTFLVGRQSVSWNFLKDYRFMSLITLSRRLRSTLGLVWMADITDAAEINTTL